MKNNLNAFTLIEMLIVIFILTIILWFTMNFSGDRIQLLNNKNTEEEFITAYNDQYLIALNSNYIDWKSYDKLDISFASWSTQFAYNYKLNEVSQKSGTNNVSNKLKIKQLCIWGEGKTNLIIQYSPYELWCQLNGGEWVATIKIWVNNDREDKCFEISSKLWRLISIKCATMCQSN